MSSADWAIEFDGVGFAYGEQAVLEHVSLRVPKGEFLALIGPNGGGKSTMIKLALGLLEPTAGSVSVLGVAPRRAASRVGYVPQFSRFAHDFPISVRETVLLGRLGRRAWWLPLNRRDRQAADDALAETDVLDLAARSIASLSGGQLQRVLLARALATEPEILLLDEPTAHVDTLSERNLFDRLAEFGKRMTIVVVSHDVGLVSRYVGNVACLNHTLLCHTTVPLQPGMLEQLYGAPVRLVDHVHGVETSA
jgi:zinc transport system ATP-binding protein